jgi:tetratricopeptide (TPR) repeat protein
MDYFFKTTDNKRKYIAALDENGYGLVQTSTRRLKGRKLFVWGQGEGGHTWQRFLTDKAGDYAEIQAGLGQTQYECIPMPPLASWEWVEGYGAMSADPSAVHSEWMNARREVENKLNEILTEAWLEDYLINSKKDYVCRNGFLIQNGSGFGALENKRREIMGEQTISAHLDFGAVQEQQKHWLALLEKGQLPCPSINEQPPCYMIGGKWYELLQAAHDHEDKNWYEWYHKGIMQISNGQYGEAYDSLMQSVSICPSCWGYYGLAICTYAQRDLNGSIALIKQAAQLNPHDLSLMRDFFRLMHENACYQDIIDTYFSLGSPLQSDGKLKFYLANAYAHSDLLDQAEAILYENGCLIVPDIREGELSITELWLYIEKEKYKKQNRDFNENLIIVPSFLDYRMGCASE